MFSASLKRDEDIRLFNTAAVWDGDKQQWLLPIHGWVFEPYTGSVRQSLIQAVLREKYHLEVTQATQDTFNRRTGWFLVDNERGKKIEFTFEGKNYTAQKSKPNGHFKRVLELDQQPKAFSQVRAKNKAGDWRSADVHLIAAEGISIISDIDDTIKVTGVTNHRQMMENTFLKPFQAVNGFSELFQDWVKQGATIHLVSSSPWYLYPELEHFFKQSQYPSMLYHLKPVRFRDETLLNLFKPGQEYKIPVIERIIKRFPKRQFILIGDSGEADPEVYLSIAQAYSSQIKAIFIRNVTGDKVTDERYKGFADLRAKPRFALFKEVSELPKAFAEFI